jgi:ketosteroid isomerase-like protein
MSENSVEVIRSMYLAFAVGDVPAVLEKMDPRVEWNEAENFPYADGNPYIGPDAVVKGVFARLGDEWDGWSLAIDELLDAGDTVVATGRYSGTYKETGGAINAQFVHVWKVRDRKAVSFQQYTDTAQVQRAMGGE